MLKQLICCAILIGVVVLLIRRGEVRLVLLGACAALFALAGRFPDMLVNLASELTNVKTVIPICASMGFAYVLRITECDRHLVQLLLRPLERPFARFLLIPGTIIVGYIVNMAIVSQSGAVAIVGSIAVPLLLRKGISRLTVGSLLLLGASMGGELFNPGAVETVTLSKLTGISSVTLAQRAIPFDLLACVIALIVYWRTASLYEMRVGNETAEELEASNPARNDLETSGHLKDLQISGGPAPGTQRGADADIQGAISSSQQGTDTEFKVSLAKAAVPFVPLVLLFAGSRIPILRPFHDQVTILAAMLIGCVAAGLVSPHRIGRLGSAFFEGTGFAYANIISVTVCATLFAQGIIANGLVQRLVSGLAGRPGPALFASLALPWGLATLSGSGAGAAVSMMNALIPGASSMHLNSVLMGILAAMGSHFGRTMSPAAAVAILCAALVSPQGAASRELGTTTLALTRRVATPLLIGGIALYAAGLIVQAR